MKNLFVGVFLVFAMVPVVSGQNDRFGPEGEKRVIEKTKWLETNPLGDKDKSIHTELMEWWVEAPHVTVNWCAGILLDTKNDKARSIVVLQGLFGAGAFILENPKEEYNSVSFTRAGVKSALIAYQNAVMQNKKYKDKFLDKLVEGEKTGYLESYISKKLKECEESE